jgi:hypothetical protein
MHVIARCARWRDAFPEARATSGKVGRPAPGGHRSTGRPRAPITFARSRRVCGEAMRAAFKSEPVS